MSLLVFSALIFRFYYSGSSEIDEKKNVSFSDFDCDKLKLEVENLNADQTYDLKAGAVTVDNFGTAFYEIEESQEIKMKVTLKNSGKKLTFCSNETPFASNTAGTDFFVDDDTITSFGPIVETFGCDEKMTIQAGEKKTTTLELSGTIGFTKTKELDPKGWIESALMSIDLIIPDTITVGDFKIGKEVCDLRAKTSIKLRQTFRIAEKKFVVKAEIDDVTKKDDFCQKILAGSEGADVKCEVGAIRKLEEGNVKLLIMISYPIDKIPEDVENFIQKLINDAAKDTVTVENIEIVTPSPTPTPANESTASPVAGTTVASAAESTVAPAAGTTVAQTAESNAAPEAGNTAAPESERFYDSSPVAAPTTQAVAPSNTSNTTADDGWSLDNFKGSVEYNDKQVPRFSPACMDYPELTGFTLSDGKPAPCSMICDQDIGLLCAESCGLCSKIDEIYTFVNEKKKIDYISCNDTQTQTLDTDVAAFYSELCPSILLGFKEDEASATGIFKKWLGTRMTKDILHDEVVQICSLNKFSFHCNPNSVNVDNPICSDSLTSGTVAYVYSTKTDPRVIYNCPFYFALPKDIRLSTIFHEISHFTDITNTSDVPGGYTTSNQLEFAKTNVGITNAGNWDAMSVDSKWKKQGWPSSVLNHLSI